MDFCIKNPYLRDKSTAACVFCLLERCIEAVGARRTPGWGEKQEAYFILRRTVMRNRDSRAHYFASTVAAKMERIFKGEMTPRVFVAFLVHNRCNLLFDMTDTTVAYISIRQRFRL